MSTSGVEVRPIVTAFRTDEFAEVFFTGAEVPAANLVGEPGQGWEIAMSLLQYERGPADMGWIGRMSRTVHGLADRRDPEVARAGSWLHALERKVAETLAARAEGSASDAEGSVDKLLLTRVDQMLHSLWLDLSGPDALVTDGEPMRRYLWSRAAGIFGGTSQIQRTIVATRVLGLPRA